MSLDNAPVTVHILDKEYRIVCSAQERQGLLESARMLDQRMREVRQHGRVIGSDRIAVMAALNLIYDMMKESDNREQFNHRLKLMQERVNYALKHNNETDAEH